MAFGLFARHYHPAADLFLHCEYPTSEYRADGRRLSLQIEGDPRLTCRLRLVAVDGVVPEAVLLYAGEKVAEGRSGERTAEGHVEWQVPAGQQVTVRLADALR